MKILVVCENIFPPAVDATGMSTIYRIQKELRREGVDIHILTTIRSWSNPSYDNWFKAQEKQFGFHFHYVNASFLGRIPLCYSVMSKLLILLKVIKLNSKYSYQIIHDYSSSPVLLILTATYKRLMNKPVFHTLCAYNNSFLGSFNLASNTNCIDKIICTSRDIEKKILQRVKDRKKIVYLPFGIDTTRFQKYVNTSTIRKKTNILPNEKVVLFLGPLEDRKGAFTLAKAVKFVIQKNPNTVFLFATYGKGGVDKDHDKHKQRLLNMCKQNARSVHIIEGRHDVPLLMNLADVFVLPPTSLDGTLAPPSTLLEAMAAGKACVVSDIEGIAEVVKDGKTVLKYQSGNHEMLSKKISEFLSSEQLRNDLGRRAKEAVLESYDVRSGIKELKKKYEQTYFNYRCKQRVIAFVGIDGCGKTTTAKAIAKILIKEGVDAVCISPFRYIILKRLLGILKRTESTKTADNPFLVTCEKPFYVKIWPLLVLFDNWICYLFKIKPLIRKGQTVICDRYFFDFAVSFEYLGYTNNIINRIYLLLIPKPNGTILLDVDPIIAQKREIGDSHDLYFFTKQRQRYLLLARKLGFKLVDSSKTIDEVQREVINAL